MKWIPEARPPSGGLAAEGFYKLLGRPRLDPLTVLVRETAQNSWDARLENGEPVEFSIQGSHFSDSERQALRSRVFVDAERARGTNLAAELSAPNLIGFYISDRNTKGLGGPLQADQVDPEGVYDWVDLVLNAGEANTQGHTGGTYGFGKTITYVVSAANAIVIHSRSICEGQVQTRLIACALGERFTWQRQLFTGRHWWAEAGAPAPVPVTGQAAEAIASDIGMPNFGDDTGTNILVIAPDLGGRSPAQAMRFIAESVTWHLWPKLMPHDGRRAMHINVGWNGAPIAISKPEDRPPLHGFAQAFQAILDSDATAGDVPGLRVETIRCQRPKAEVGLLATVPLIHRDRVGVDDGSDSDNTDAPKPAAAIGDVCHHVALLRTPELVVTYLEGPAPPEGGTEWAGVFRASNDQDHHFAAAEPPTHDSWNPDLLPKSPGRTIVNVGLREIKAALENRWASRQKPPRDEVASTAVVADELAHLVGAIDGRGRGRHRKEPVAPKRGASRPQIDFTYSAPIEIAGRMATLARFLVGPAQGSVATRLHIKVAAALDGNSADADLDPLLAISEAKVEGDSVDIAGRVGTIDVNSPEAVEIELVVQRGPETTVLFDVDAEPIA